MDLWNIDKLQLFIAFVIPGFLLLKVNAVLGLEPAADSSKQVVDAVTYSCINYALLLWPILAVENSNLRVAHQGWYFAFYGFVVLICPVILALIWRSLRTTPMMQSILPHPVGKPWDYVFRQRLRYWVLVTFKDGKQIAGLYDSKSFSSASPIPEQLYLEQAWTLNAEGGFERPRTNTAGILVIGSEIRSVELINVLSEEDDGDKSHTTRSGTERLATSTSEDAYQSKA
ncbi:MAG: DUF6338 family protein [Pseudomonadota bacterium]